MLHGLVQNILGLFGKLALDKGETAENLRDQAVDAVVACLVCTVVIVDRDGEIAVVGGQCDQTVDLLVIVEAVVDRGCIGEVSFVGCFHRKT